MDGSKGSFHFVSDPADCHVYPLFPLGNLVCPCAFVHDAAFQLHPAEYLFVLGRVVSFICKDRSSPGSLCLLQRGFEMFDVALIGRGSLLGENESVLIRNRMALIAEM